MSGRGAWALAIVLAPLGCGPGVQLEDSDASSSSGAAEPSTSGADVGTSPSTGHADGTTAGSGETGEPPGGYEDDDGGTGCTFTCPPPPPPSGGGGGFFECNLQAQDCPEGEKCSPWASDGGNVWSSTRCVPVAERPGQPGDACQVEGHGTSGIDDCAIEALCWGVDPETLLGACHALCSVDEPTCPAGLTCMNGPGLLSLCVEPCDPVVGGCGGATSSCLPMGSGFTCQPHDGLGAALGEPCDAPDACATGSLCAFDPAITCGGMPGQGCCTAPCDVNAPGLCSGAGSSCVPWFPVRPPPGLAHVGVCAGP